jgi:hypothetical protein
MDTAEVTGSAGGWSVAGLFQDGWHWTAFGPKGTEKGTEAEHDAAMDKAEAAAARLKASDR